MMSSEIEKPTLDRDKPLDGKLLYISPNFFYVGIPQISRATWNTGWIFGGGLFPVPT